MIQKHNKKKNKFAYLDTNVVLIADKIGYWNFVKLSKKYDLILTIGVMAEIRKISQSTNRILWALIKRNYISIISEGQGQSFDCYALKLNRLRCEIISLDKTLRAKYYKNKKVPIVLSRNKFITFNA